MDQCQTVLMRGKATVIKTQTHLRVSEERGDAGDVQTEAPGRAPRPVNAGREEGVLLLPPRRHAPGGHCAHHHHQHNNPSTRAPGGKHGPTAVHLESFTPLHYTD